MKNNFLLTLYHRFLGLFFDFELHVYASQTPKIPINKLEKEKTEITASSQIVAIPKLVPKCNSLEKPSITTHSTPSLSSLLVLHNLNNDFYYNLLIKAEQLNFFCIKRNYNINLLEKFRTKKENLNFQTVTNKINHSEIKISNKLNMTNELIEFEPYIKSLKTKKLLTIPIIKQPTKKSKFTELQLNKMRTKLAIAAKCKVYSMSLENIYENIIDGLFEEITLEKDNSLKCLLKKHPEIGEKQLFITGKRKYDTQLTKTFIKYSEL